MNRSILTLSALAVAMISAPPAAKAWATYVSAAQDNLTMIVTAITDTNYAMAGQHTAFATAWVSNPSGRTSQNTIFHANVAITSTFLPIDPEDGEFTIGNMEPKEFCPLAMITYYLSPVYSPETVDSWIQLVRTTGQGTDIGIKDVARSATVHVATSPGCMGEVEIVGILGNAPNAIDAEISADPPDGDGNPSPNSAVSRRIMAGQSMHDFNFTVRTLKSNGHTGELSLLGSIEGHPGCQLKGPSQGQSNLKIWQVK